MVIKFPELVSYFSNNAISREVAHFMMLFLYSVCGSENFCDVIIKRTVMATKPKSAKKEHFCPFIFQRLN